MNTFEDKAMKKKTLVSCQLTHHLKTPRMTTFLLKNSLISQHRCHYMNRAQMLLRVVNQMVIDIISILCNEVESCS